MKRFLGIRQSCICFGILLGSSAWAQGPSALKVVSATSTQTQLSWSGSASSYVIQRAPVGGPVVTLATISTTSYTDNTVDPYLQFTYTIAANGASSNAVTVGPPPAGLSLAAPAPVVGAQPSQSYGENISLAFDGNGDPAVAFLWVDPKNAGDDTQTQLLFRNWNRSTASWNAVVTIATIGDISTGFRAPLSLAFDKSTNNWAIASEDGDSALRVYSSADGATWTLRKTYSGATSAWAGPSIALGAGNLYVSAQQASNNLQYITGKLSDPTTWTQKTAPSVKGVGPAAEAMTSIALDSAGNPAVAYWADDASGGYNETLLFWRPSISAAPLKVTDSQSQQTDTAVKMTFDHLNPRIAFYALRLDSTDNNDGIHFVRSDDGGNTWTTPVLIPPDGESSTDYPFDMAVNSKGAGLVVFGQNSGNGTNLCGSPEISRSTDLTTWNTCSPVSSFGDYGAYPSGIQTSYQGNDKMYIVWWNPGTDVSNTGVVIYREKPDNQPTGPIISSVQDAESAGKNVVQGQWIAIYGANLATDSRAWGGNDFNGNNLPTQLDGTSVSFNGIPAAVFYISPTQLDAQVPNGVSGTVAVTVTSQDSVSGTFNANIVANQPSLFVYPAGTKLYAAATHADGSLIGDPAVIGNAGTKTHAGETIILYVNGLANSPAGVITGGIPYANPVTVTMTSASGQTSTAAAIYSGLSFAGGFQVNFVVPAGLAPGDYTVTVTTVGVTSLPGVTLTVG